MKIAEIRTAFLEFFEQKGHKRVASSSLVPADDPTLLFTNAGMVQFKDVFLGKEKRSYDAAVTAQKVVRAGGKHNDLENVGYTARHHTFFEMMGNFSFGSYFKAEAQAYAWEFVTKVLRLPAERLWITVYEDDDESYALWRDKIGVPESRIVRLGEDSNFWSMGDTGPCGPCTEMFFDHGPDVAGGPPGSPDEDGDRYVEFWNLVFMQYERGEDGSMAPLATPAVDTGMGLERVATIMQSVHSNYDTDLFRALISTIADQLGVSDLAEQSLKVLADHIRSCSFLIADGVLPSNEGRGYVLRRIIRRALRHGRKLGAEGTFFSECVKCLVAQMGDAYPELVQQQTQIERVLSIEEEKFLRTLEQGMKHLEAALAATEGQLAGDVAFTLYDTYGFPLDLTADVARERGLYVDVAGFDAAMAQRQEDSRKSEKFGSESYARIDVGQDTVFIGYEHFSSSAKMLLVADAQGAPSALASGQLGVLVLDQTPFYGESGGQTGDAGIIEGANWRFNVTHTTKNGNVVLHHGRVESGSIAQVLGSKHAESVQAKVDVVNRQAIMRNHSATHLLHAALRRVAGDQVEQKGSLVTADRLRFDFSSFEALTSQQIEAVETLVNEQILANTPVETALMSQEDAIKLGAMALFGEKYGEQVRVLTMGVSRFSVELCGGTHVAQTGQIGCLRIVSETGIAAGVRRVEAVTGLGALAWSQQTDALLQACAFQLKAPREHVVQKLEHLQGQVRHQEKEIARLKAKLASGAGSDLSARAVDVGDIKVLSVQLSESADAKGLRSMADQVRQRLGRSAVVLAAVSGDKVQLVAAVSEDLQSLCPAGRLVNHVAQQVGGKGGGKPHMAMAGGQNTAALSEALASVQTWVSDALQKSTA
jgi:alanyl-tRNA synthetase